MMEETQNPMADQEEDTMDMDQDEFRDGKPGRLLDEDFSLKKKRKYKKRRGSSDSVACPKCNRNFTRMFHLRRHLLNESCDNNMKKNYVLYCDIHKRTYKDPKEARVGCRTLCTLTYMCKECRQEYENRSGIDYHYRKMHKVAGGISMAPDVNYSIPEADNYYNNTEHNELLECLIKEENEDASQDCKLEPVVDYGPADSVGPGEMQGMQAEGNRSCFVKTEDLKLEPVDDHESALTSYEPGEADEWLDSAGTAPVPVPLVRNKKRKLPSNSATCPKCSRSFVRSNGLKRHTCKQIATYDIVCTTHQKSWKDVREAKVRCTKKSTPCALVRRCLQCDKRVSSRSSIIRHMLIHKKKGGPVLDPNSEADYVNTENNKLLECIINEENEDEGDVGNTGGLKLEPVDNYGSADSMRLGAVQATDHRFSGVKSEQFKLEPVDYHEPVSIEPGEADDWHDVNLNSAVPVPLYPGYKLPSDATTCLKCNRNFTRMFQLRRHLQNGSCTMKKNYVMSCSIHRRTYKDPKEARGWCSSSCILTYVCTECRKEYKNRSGINYHYRKEHKHANVDDRLHDHVHAHAHDHVQAADPLHVEAPNLSTATVENIFSDEQSIKTEEGIGEDPLSIDKSEDCSSIESKPDSNQVGYSEI